MAFDRVARFRAESLSVANGLAALFGGPVYLVGSALDPDVPEPGDYDVRQVITPAESMRLFGTSTVPWENVTEPGGWDTHAWRSAYLCRKYSVRWSRAVGLTVDYQLQVGPRAALEEKPRFRLDNAPDWLWRAGKGEAL